MCCTGIPKSLGLPPLPRTLVLDLSRYDVHPKETMYRSRIELGHYCHIMGHCSEQRLVVTILYLVSENASRPNPDRLRKHKDSTACL